MATVKRTQVEIPLDRNQVEVTLVKRHEHAGVQYDAGTTLVVHRSDAKLMLNMKVIKELPASK